MALQSVAKETAQTTEDVAREFLEAMSRDYPGWQPPTREITVEQLYLRMRLERAWQHWIGGKSFPGIDVRWWEAIEPYVMGARMRAGEIHFRHAARLRLVVSND